VWSVLGEENLQLTTDYSLNVSTAQAGNLMRCPWVCSGFNPDPYNTAGQDLKLRRYTETCYSALSYLNDTFTFAR